MAWRLSLLIVLFLAQVAAAQHRTLAKSEWGEVFCTAEAEIKPTVHPDRFTVSTPSGPIHIVTSYDGVIIQYPDQALRVRRSEVDEGTQILVQFNRKNYRVLQKKREWEWQFPDDEAYFRLRAGSVYDVLGTKGFLKIRRRGPIGNYRVVSEAGESHFEVGKDGIETHEGATPEQHPYLAPGVIFQEGPVGVAIYLPQRKLISSLDWSLARRYTTPLPEPPAPPPPAEPEVDPLRANQPEWHNPVMTPNAGDPKEDPLKLKPKPVGPPEKGVDLKAKTSPDSDELLKVKELKTE